MNTALNSIMRQKAFGWFSPTNCGRKAKKKIVSLRFGTLSRMPETVTSTGEAGCFLADRQRIGVAQGAPRHGDEVGHAKVLQCLERQRTRTRQCREAGDWRDHVRDDPDRAADRQDDAGANTVRESGGQGIEHSWAGGSDDRPRRQQKRNAHSDTPSCVPAHRQVLAPRILERLALRDVCDHAAYLN